jgi:DNA-binding transcriptional MerR regulator
MSSESTPGMAGTEAYLGVQEAARLLGISPATLRAWERRHGIPRPRRAANGYRLYSPADLETLRRIKARTDDGVRVGLAVEGLIHPSAPARLPDQDPFDQFSDRLTQAIARFDEREATGVLRQALVLYPVEDVMDSLIGRTLGWLGAEWIGGRLTIGAEHFASALFLRQLMLLYSASPDAWRPGKVLAACAPGDEHQIGVLMVLVGLRRRGWSVHYLGPNLPVDELERAAVRVRPHALLISAACRLGSETLAQLAALPRRLPAPSPALVLGGQAFLAGEPRPDGALILNGPLSESLYELDTLLLRASHGG